MHIFRHSDSREPHCDLNNSEIKQNETDGESNLSVNSQLTSLQLSKPSNLYSTTPFEKVNGLKFLSLNLSKYTE